MLTLALDTSTPGPSLALADEAGAVAALRLAPSPAAGRRVMQAVHGLMQATGLTPPDLGRVVVGVGPGGFTGLRIGMASAMGLGQALGIPVVGAVSLEALALGIADVVPAGALVAPCVDARRREVFTAIYRAVPGDGLQELLAPVALAPADLAARLAEWGTPDDPVYVAGDGAHLPAPHVDPAVARVLAATSPAHAVDALGLVRRVDAGGGRPVEPLYARLPDAEVNRRVREGAA